MLDDRLKGWAAAAGLTCQAAIGVFLLQRIVCIRLGWFVLVPPVCNREVWIDLVGAAWALVAMAAPIGIWKRKAWGFFLEVPALAPILLFAWALTYADPARHHDALLPGFRQFMVWGAAAIDVYWLWCLVRAGFRMLRRRAA